MEKFEIGKSSASRGATESPRGDRNRLGSRQQSSARATALGGRRLQADDREFPGPGACSPSLPCPCGMGAIPGIRLN